MLTLSEVSQRTGISMPTLQRYKKIYQSRIPAEGKGRKQRYPESALPVFEELKVENAGRRGRPRKNASAPAATAGRRGRKPAAAAAAATAAKKAPGRRGRKPAAAAAKTAKKAAAPVRGGRKAAGARGKRGGSG
ncbi:MAG: helix-turn-helix domain-containing protein, partial [Acidobacteriota bacterium]